MAYAIPQKSFAAGSRQVTQVGLGGEGILRTTGRTPHARKVIQEAISLGITYFDSAPAYQESELYLGSIWKENPSIRQKIFQGHLLQYTGVAGQETDVVGVVLQRGE